MSTSKCFFKVIFCPTLHDHKLSIPDKFVKKYGNELSDLVRLMVPTGDIWYVRVEKKTDKTIWFREGLHKFMEDHSIGFGYFLIFKYKGNSTFKVHICDLTAYEIDYPNNSNSARHDDINQLSISNQKEHDDGHHDKSGDEDNDDSSIEILDSSTDHQLLGRSVQSSEFASGNKRSSVASAERWKPHRCYLTRSKKQKMQDDLEIEATGVQDFIPPRRNEAHQSNGSTHKVTADEAVLVSSGKANRKITSNANGKNSVKDKSVGSKFSSKNYLERRPAEVQVNRAIQAANMSLPKNRCYMLTMKSYNLHNNNIVHLPSEFARLYLSYTSKFIKLQDADDNEWEVRCTAGKYNCHLTKGWINFARAKNLKVGDVCLFEPIRINEEVKLKVNIRHAIKYAANVN